MTLKNATERLLKNIRKTRFNDLVEVRIPEGPGKD